MIKKNTVEVCYSPIMYDLFKNDNAITVVVDVLRATTSICTAFHNGVKKLYPVENETIAAEMKKQGYLVAAERNGIALDFADFGNSPFNFTKDNVENKELVYTTTNGTKSIMLAKDSYKVVIGAFVNLSALTQWLVEQQKDVIILCAGWKDKYNIEDSVGAGAISERLIKTERFITNCDSAITAIDMWKHWEFALSDLINLSAQKGRLLKIGMDDCIDYCLSIDETDVVPILENNYLIDAKKCKK
ncbi:MAG: 2-phosphosulfolactate phosphatase [Bacteroidales bacterium]